MNNENEPFKIRMLIRIAKKMKVEFVFGLNDKNRAIQLHLQNEKKRIEL